MLSKIKYILESVLWGFMYRLENIFFKNDKINISWDYQFNNFGDILTPYLLSKITDRKIQRIGKSLYFPYEHYLCIGSILNRANEKTIVWGSGFISEDSTINGIPKKICAVRGPKTRNKLLGMGIECPEIYGDPGLLISKFYNPQVDKKYKLGIIPHYIDKNSPWLKMIENNFEVKIIDIQVKNPTDFIKELLSCEKIASSSLHGIITADSYSIPSVWIEFSKNVKGNGFKFIDYFLSVGREDTSPLAIHDNIDIDDVYKAFYNYKIDIDIDALLSACPFKSHMIPNLDS